MEVLTWWCGHWWWNTMITGWWLWWCWVTMWPQGLSTTVTAFSLQEFFESSLSPNSSHANVNLTINIADLNRFTLLLDNHSTEVEHHFQDLYEEQLTNGSHSVELNILEFWPWQVLLICLYTLTAILSLTLNIVTICVWLRGDRSISTELWKFLVNLSVADIGMSLFCIPFTYTNVMLQQWIFPNSLCPVVNFAQSCFVFVSVWTLTVIGIDRYFAIVHPLYLFHWITSYKQTIILSIWVCGALFASIQLVVSHAVPYERGGQLLYNCFEDWSSEASGQAFTLAVFVLTFAAPMLILIFVYTTISYHILVHVTPGNPDSLRDSNQLNRKIKVLKMLITVVGLFALCWLPLHCFTLVNDFVPAVREIRSSLGFAVFYGTFFSSHFFAMVHSLINPVVYCFMSENFRNNLWNIVGRCINRIKSCDRVGTMVSEHIELDVAATNGSQDNTFTSYNFRTRKTQTKISGNQQEQNITSAHTRTTSITKSQQNGTSRWCGKSTANRHQNHKHCHTSSREHSSTDRSCSSTNSRHSLSKC